MAHTDIRIRVPRVLNITADEFRRAMRGRFSDDSVITVDVVEPKFTYKIHRDEDAGSPRRENDNLGVMALKHGRYDLGDKDAELPFVNGDWREGTLRDDVFLCKKVYLYDHGGITISHSPFSCQWDSGMVGWHYITKQALLDNWPDIDLASEDAMQKANDILDGELEEYDAYLQGEVWGYTITDEEGDEVDSCWGFIGDDPDTNGILDQAGSEHKDGLREAWNRRSDQ